MLSLGLAVWTIDHAHASISTWRHSSHPQHVGALHDICFHINTKVREGYLRVYSISWATVRVSW